MKNISVLIGVLLMVAYHPAVAQNVVTNGTFESLTGNGDSSSTTFTGWSEFTSDTSASAVNSAVVHAGISGTDAARLPGQATNSGVLRQDVAGPTVNWQFDVDFAMADPGDTSGTTERGFNLFLIHHTSSGGKINLRVIDEDGDSNGEVQVYNGSVFVTVLGDVVPFSIDLNGNGVLTDAGDTFSPVHLTIAGTYGFTPTYVVTVGSSSSAALSHFQTNAPSTTNNNIDRIAFAASTAGTQSFVVDNVSLIPEPGTGALLLGGLGTLLGFRRSRRRHRC
jgi:hypothetical protein